MSDMDEMIEICQIFKKHNMNNIAGASHDVIWFSAKEIKDEADVKRLDSLGVVWSEEYDCYSKFV